MNPYPLIAGLALFACTAIYAVWERSQAESWHQQFSSLQASYSQVALKAQQDAQAQEAKDNALNQKQAQTAIQQAKTQTKQAQQKLVEYKKKLAAAASEKDLGHRCAGVKIPEDLKP